MMCLERLQQYLRAEKVPFELQHHAEAYTAQEVAASEHVPGKQVVKVVVVVNQDGNMAMLALPASYVVDFQKLRQDLHAGSVRLADENEFALAFPDCEIGAMPPFGHLYKLPVFVDNALAQDERIIFRAGTHTDTVSVRFADYQRLVQPRILDFAHQN